MHAVHHKPLSSSGYASQDYAASLAELGQPLELKQSGAWLLARTVPGAGDLDAMGLYPLLCCPRPASLHADISALASQLVSLTAVINPQLSDLPAIQSAFDAVTPFKEHYIVDLTKAGIAHISKHHLYYAKRCRQRLKFSTSERPSADLAAWTQLYDHLIATHGLQGIHRFSPTIFAKQLAMPDLVLFKATYADRIVAMHSWMVTGEIAYSHLAAASAEGYEQMASYGLYLHAIDHFRGQCPQLNLGGSAGLKDSGKGLAQFKRGWATHTSTAYLCRKTFNHERYRYLVALNQAEASSYFPAYRERSR